MTMVLRPGESVDDLVAPGTGSCPACGGPLRRWGYGRTRTVRGMDLPDFRPGRVRCIGCRVTQIVLPADVLVRRRDAVAVVGRAWRWFAAGAGARRVARRLEVPMETVRGWLRRLRALARVITTRALLPAVASAGRSELRAALAIVETEAEAAGWPGEVALWRFVAYRSQGRLLATPADPARRP